MTCSFDRVRALDGSCLLSGWSKEMEDGVNQCAGFTAACCSRQGTFLLGLAAEGGKLLVLVSLLTARILGTLRMPQGIRSLAWSPVEDLLAVGTHQAVLLFRSTQDGFEGYPCQVTEHAQHVHALSFSCDGTLLASRDDEGLKIWDVINTKLITGLHDNVEKSSGKSPSPGIAFHPTMPLLATVTPQETGLRILDVSQLI